jgi:hypothetical protein
MLPLQRVIEIKDSVTLQEARRILEDEGVDALLIEKPLMQGWVVLLRGEVLGEARQSAVA